MKYVFISKAGDIFPLAQRVEDEGNSVRFYVCPDEGLIVDKHLTDNAPDIFVLDSPGFGNITTRLKAAGYPVVGCSKLSDQLDSFYSERILLLCGLPIVGSNGLEIVIDGWFNGKQFINYLYTIDDIVCPANNSDKIIEEGIKKLAGALSKAQYSGPVSLTAVIAKDSVYYKDLKAQFSASTLLIMKEGLKTKASYVLQAMALKENRMFMFKPGYFSLVQISINSTPLFNSSNYYTIEAPIADEVIKHIWLYGFSNSKDGVYTYRGKGGRIAVATARGDTIREARRRVYRTVFNLKLKDILFLDKVGHNATGWYGLAKQWNWIS